MDLPRIFAIGSAATVITRHISTTYNISSTAAEFLPICTRRYSTGQRDLVAFQFSQVIQKIYSIM